MSSSLDSVRLTARSRWVVLALAAVVATTAVGACSSKTGNGSGSQSASGARFLVDARGFNKVQGLPIVAEELEQEILRVLDE